MIKLEIECRRCTGVDLVKNGSVQGRAKYSCKACGYQGYFTSVKASREAKYELVEKLLVERNSQRSIVRITGVSRMTIARLIKKAKATVSKKSYKKKVKPVLELDEMWSFVGNKGNKVWIWLALECTSRKIIAWTTGDRSEQAAQKLFDALPKHFRKKAVFFTDSWKAYRQVLPKKRHRIENHQINHIERFNNTIRQRLPVLVRKTLSFSKSLIMHQYRIQIFINQYNTLI
jgi:insertion element IS1 protein InsB